MNNPSQRYIATHRLTTPVTKFGMVIDVRLACLKK
jgi:hypothetical protein